MALIGALCVSVNAQNLTNVTKGLSFVEKSSVVLSMDDNAKAIDGQATLQHCEDSFSGGIGTNSAATFDCAHRWTPAQLEEKGIPTGATLTKISFIPAQASATFTLKVWQGGSWTTTKDPGTLLATQVLSTSSLVLEEWNEITLTTPVEIDASKELWFGYECAATGGHPAGNDGAPKLATYGDLMFFNGSWQTMDDAGGGELPYNWNIRGLVEGDIDPPCPGVTNLAAELQGEDVRLTWNPPTEGSPTGYKIYKNGSAVETIQETFYMFKNLDNGEYEFGVEALHNDVCIPLNVRITVKVNKDGFPVQNLKVASNDNCVADLSWDAPIEAPDYEGWITYSKDQITGRLGFQADQGMEMWAISRFTPGDLSTYGVNTGQTITKVSIGVGDSDVITSYKVCVWQGGTSPSDPGELLVEQDVPVSTLVGNSTWNDFTLNAPFEIDATKELWVGYKVINTGGYPITRDAGPGVEGKGNIMWFADYGWGTLSTFYSSVNANLCIKTFVEARNGKEIVLGGSPKAPAGYDIYCDDVKVGTTTDLTYQHRVEKSGNYNYCVVASYGEKQSPKVCDDVDISCFCEPPTNVQIEIEQESCYVMLSWSGVGTTYNVYKNNELAEAATKSPYIAVIEAGVDIEFCITTICSDTESEKACAEIVKCSNAIGKNNLESLRIYPNPATSVVTIVGEDIAKVEIYNVVGQMVEVKTGNVTTIDVSAYNNGIYLFRVYDSNNNVATQRVMVSK